MTIALASDHAGFRYKTLLAAWLPTLGHEVVDFGAHSAESSDYPDFVMPAARAVALGHCARGIVVGGSGNGEAIAANRVDGIRCVLCWDEETARLGRAHNDANVISIGERLVAEDALRSIVGTWLETPFDGGRHARRVAKLDLRGPAAGDVIVVTAIVSVPHTAVEARRRTEPLPDRLRADGALVVQPLAGRTLLLAPVVAPGTTPDMVPGAIEAQAREVRAALDAWCAPWR